MNRYLRNFSRSILFAGGVAAAGTGYMIFEAQWLRLVHRRLVITELPASLEGLRLLHVSDLHAGAPGPNSRSIAKFTRAARRLAPDIILFTGDQTDKKRDLSPFINRLASVEARYSKFAVLGNHDHGLRKTVIEDLSRRLTGRPPTTAGRADDDGAETVSRNRALLMEAGIWLLENQCVTVEIGDDKVQFCGIDDLQYGLADLEAVSRELDTDAGLRVLLSHSPNALDDVRPGDFHLMLSGHTHGGQICLPSLRDGKTMLSTSGSVYGEGIYEKDGTMLHISRGVGTTLVPFRLMSRPEITLLELFASEKTCGCGSH